MMGVIKPLLAWLRRSTTRLWFGAFLGFFLVFGAWALAAPYSGPADEIMHTIRAVGVVSGQIMPEPVVMEDYKGNQGMGAVQRVPAGLGNKPDCWGYEPEQPATCAQPISGGELKDIKTTAGRYNPTYYAMVGWPVKFWPGWTGLILARLLSGALSAALLAFAFTTLVRRSKYGLMLAGLVAASTPMLAHLAGAINPNGLEIAAGIAFFAAGIPLFLDRTVTHRGPLIALAGVSAILVASLRPLGPVWLAAGLGVLLIKPGWSGLKRMLGEGATTPWRFSGYGIKRAVRERPGVRWSAGIALSVVLAIVWMLVMKTGDVSALVPKDGPDTLSVTQAFYVYVTQWGSYLNGMVGVAGWFDVFMIDSFYYLWISAVVMMIFFTIVFGGGADRWRLVVFFLGGFVVPAVLQVSQANTAGFIIGGRYMLPLLVGLPLLGAFVAEQNGLSQRHSRAIVKLYALLLLPVHGVLLVYAMRRWQQGLNVGSLNPFTGAWHPPLGSVLPVAVMGLGICVLGFMFWRNHTAEVTVAEEPLLDNRELQLAKAEA